MRHHIDNATVTLTVAAIQAHTGDPVSLSPQPFVTQDDNWYDGSLKKNPSLGRVVILNCRWKEELTTLTFSRTEHPHDRRS
jgi:hypothetical protein